jgi:squalene synthase HpnC
MAIYGFARLVDYLGDEYPGDRLEALDALEEDLERAYADFAHHPLLRRLAPTLRECALPREPFARLIEANRRDQRVTRYATQADLFDYCRYSADPVGRLVLRVFGASTPERIALSDSICTGLQLAEHAQDVAEDFAAGRIYLPLDLLAECGASEADLAAPSASPALRSAVRREAELARSHLLAGAPLIAALRGPARLAVAGFCAGGHAALDGLARVDFDVLGRRPRTAKRDLARHFAAILVRARRRSP